MGRSRNSHGGCAKLTPLQASASQNHVNTVRGANWASGRPPPSVASAFFFRGDSAHPGGRARARLWALRAGQARVDGPEERGRGARRARRAGAELPRRLRKCQSEYNDSRAAAQECARANNGSVDTEIERQATTRG